MNPQTPLSPDDPRLTLYALGEMDAPERTGFEKLLEQDAEARRLVDDIRATAEAVTGALEHEAAAPAAAPAKPAGKILRFPQLYFMISGLAAACFAVFFVVWQKQHVDLPATRVVEVPLAPAPGAVQVNEADKKADEGRMAMPVAEAESSQASAPRSVDAVNAPVAQASVAQTEARQMLRARKEQIQRQELAQAKTRSAPGAAPAGVRLDKDETVTLEPFSVATTTGGYLHGNTMAGSRQIVGGVTGALARERDFNTEAYGYRKDNDFLRAVDNPLSTFSVDVDTASYANVRRFLASKQLPPADAVRIEELVNYFPYSYEPPKGEAPFAASLEVAGAPWAPEHRLVRIGLKGREVGDAQRPAANLVFLLDVSGSMDEPNKLPLVKQSLRLLVEKLRPDDRVAIAVYAGASGLALPSTSAREKAKILAAIEELSPGGSTNGAMGIHLAYDLAKANFITGGINRVILATDGDFNVGTTSEGELTRLVQEKAKSGVFLSVLGFGMGNLKDSTLESLADKGNGNYAYIDTLAEAKKTLVEQAGGTLVTIAKDVKIQVEFNPAQVAAYRLIGYENRLLAKEDFNNDKVDAGEIGAGHTVTALYEVVPAGADLAKTPEVDALKYQKPAEANRAVAASGELLTVSIRYKEPAGDVSSKLEFPLTDAGTRFADASPDFKFAAAVAGFGMALRDSPHKGALTLPQVTDWARAGLGQDPNGYRAEFISLVGEADALLR